jgi:hypothetical protein
MPANPALFIGLFSPLIAVHVAAAVAAMLTGMQAFGRWLGWV